ncbi:MAG: ribosome-associated translation inhibitor RaiA [Bdellovibrionaceae bacterium]|nr:ribosome-associated translation inhibitor RaiA [Pseudobdellovibrionaceae bacterium]
MKLNFDFKHLDYSKSLELYIQECVDKISHLMLKQNGGTVFISKVKGQFWVEINVQSPLRYFRSKSSHYDVYSAADLAITKLETQALKVRKMNQDHKKVELSKRGKMDQLNPRFEYKTKYRKAA